MNNRLKKELEKSLKSKIKGGISVHLYCHTFIIDVYRGYAPFWQYVIEDVYVQIPISIHVKLLTSEILKAYKADILKKYLYL